MFYDIVHAPATKQYLNVLSPNETSFYWKYTLDEISPGCIPDTNYGKPVRNPVKKK